MPLPPALYDLLIKGGRAVDPSQGINDLYDVAVANGRIAALTPEIAPSQARRTITAKGLLVTPGLIDVHVHVYPYVVDMGVEPDLVGVKAGVTTLLDAGSAGSAVFDGLPRLVAPYAKTRILGLVNIGRMGLCSAPLAEVRTREDIDIKGTVDVIQRNPGFARGVKVRAVGPGVKELGIDLIKLAKEAAREAKGQLMVHIGDPAWRVEPPLTRQLLPMLEPGDIVTHVFTPGPGHILDANNRIIPELRDAIQRGVYIDVGPGRSNFGFDVMRRALDQGIMPFTTSTDITIYGRVQSTYSLTHIMSLCMAMGLTLEDVIQANTANAAQVLGMAGELGTLREGAIADVTLLELVDGNWSFTDSVGVTIKGGKALQPVLTVKGGEVIPVDWGPHPWGWLPNPPER